MKLLPQVASKIGLLVAPRTGAWIETLSILVAAGA